MVAYRVAHEQPQIHVKHLDVTVSGQLLTKIVKQVHVPEGVAKTPLGNPGEFKEESTAATSIQQRA